MFDEKVYDLNNLEVVFIMFDFIFLIKIWWKYLFVNVIGFNFGSKMCKRCIENFFWSGNKWIKFVYGK